MTTSSTQTCPDDLIQALTGDGFTVYRAGPADQPAAAVIAFYEWDNYIDVLTVPLEGPAAAARLAKPVDVLDPPGTAVGAWVGDSDSAIGALLDLVEPEDLDAPNERLPTPDALRIPQQWRQNISVITPSPGKAKARADRLKLARIDKTISRDFFEALFAEVDDVEILAFAARFAPDGAFQFGNFPRVTGRDAIMRQVTTIHAMFASVEHEVENYEELADRAAFTIGRGMFTRHDGSVVSVPFSAHTRFDRNYRIVWHAGYVDLRGVLPCANCGFQAS